MTGIPIYNVTSNCSTGSNALILAKQLVETGQNDCVLAVGFEKMERGSLGAKVCFINFSLFFHSNGTISKYIIIELIVCSTWIGQCQLINI